MEEKAGRSKMGNERETGGEKTKGKITGKAAIIS